MDKDVNTMTETETEEKNFEILDEKTVQTMDYILRGLELGKFDETSKKVEFLGKLSGDKSPKYIAKLLERITQLETEVKQTDYEMSQHLNRIVQLEYDKTNTEGRINKLTDEMQTVAKAIRQLFEPKPLRDSYDMTEIDTFCNNNSAPSNY